MTEEKKYSPAYLNKEQIRVLHDVLSKHAKEGGEPIPPFSHAREEDIDALVSAPQQQFFGREAYPTVEEKAAILFYTVNKRQIFLNGNKRMSTLCLLVFLAINRRCLDIEPDELTKKALWLANTSSPEFQEIKTTLVQWVRDNSRPLKDGESVRLM